MQYNSQRKKWFPPVFPASKVINSLFYPGKPATVRYSVYVTHGKYQATCCHCLWLSYNKQGIWFYPRLHSLVVQHYSVEHIHSHHYFSKVPVLKLKTCQWQEIWHDSSPTPSPRPWPISSLVHVQYGSGIDNSQAIVWPTYGVHMYY